MTSDQCKKSIISFNMALMLAFIFALCSISFSILLKDELQTAASDVLAILVDSLAALALFYAAGRSSAYGRQVRMAWTIFAFALVAHTLGDIAWAYTEIVLDQPPFPSMADWLFLIQYPLFIAGILLLPTQSLTSSERLKVMLDEGIVIIASVIIFWVVLIAPTIESSAGADIRTQAFSVVYPVMGLMLLFALVELLFRRIRFQQMGPVLLLVMGTAVMIITDLILVYQSLNNRYDSGGIWDVGWIMAYSMIGLAGILQASISPGEIPPFLKAPFDEPAYARTGASSASPYALDSGMVQFPGARYIPYIFAAGAYIILLWSFNRPLAISTPHLSYSVGGIIGLIVIRQIVALKENERFFQTSKRAEEEVRRLNQHLESRVMDRTAMLKAANRKLEEEILDRKKIEEDLRRSKEAAEAATNAKSEFLANMSHEIRTPLNAVIGLTGILLGTDLNREQCDHLEIIRSSGDALLAIINDILDFSKIDSGNMELEVQPFDIKKSIEDAVDLMAPVAQEKGLTLGYDIEESIPKTIVSDPTRLRQILVNILGNAVKFTSSGEVRILVTGRDMGGREHEIHFAVMDTGIGIPAEKMGCLFQSFCQVEPCTTRRYGGAGLGLAISRRLAELMNGSIWAESEEGKGSTFHFTIRATEALSPPPGELAKGSKSSISMGPQRPLRILVAEDNIINQKVMQKMLHKLGYRADVAANGLEVLAALDRQDYDVILMDIQMPEMDGLDAARKIRETRPTWPKIIAITAFAMEGDKEKCIESGMDGYISKPVNLEELRAILRSDFSAIGKNDGIGSWSKGGRQN